MMLDKKKGCVTRKWIMSDVIIRINYIQVYWYSSSEQDDATDEALPAIRSFYNDVVKFFSGMEGAKIPDFLDPKGSGNCVSITNLNGFGPIVGGMFAGILLKQGWEFGTVQDFRDTIEGPVTNPHFIESMILTEFHMHIK